MMIRIAKDSDYYGLMLLYNGFVGEDRYLNYNNDSFKKVIKSKNNFVYVVEENKKLIGFAAFSVRTVVRYPKPIAELDELLVLPDYRRKGIGQKLMWGNFVNTSIDFLDMALVVYYGVRLLQLDKLDKKK